MRMPAGRRADIEAELSARYPGWPDGYVFVEVSEGPASRFAAVCLADDVVLSALARGHEALKVDCAQAIRAG